MATISNIADKFNAKAINNFIKETYHPKTQSDYVYVCAMMITAIFALFITNGLGDKTIFKQFVNEAIDKCI